MAVVVTVETGEGLSSANAYVDPVGAFALAYAAAWQYGTAWTGATDDARAQAIVSATRTLDAQFVWIGTPRRPGVQALGWPRIYTDGYVEGAAVPYASVPVRVQQATMEMALALMQKDRTNADGGASQSLKSLGVGDGAVKLDFGSDPAKAAVSSIIPSYIRAMLRDYGSCGGGGMVPVERQ
jgi:hypothetical protein